MQAPIKFTLILLLISAVLVAAWCFAPKGEPVAVDFVRYEQSGKDWYAWMKIRNNMSQPISYRGGAMTAEYIWDSPQIDYARRFGSSIELGPESEAPFRVLVMTTNYDWRVGVDFQMSQPSWSRHFPVWLLDRARRCRLINWGEQRTWSPQVKKP